MLKEERKQELVEFAAKLIHQKSYSGEEKGVVRELENYMLENGFDMVMGDHYGNVIAGINASGFSDPNDAGTGGDIIGACFSEGKFWGQYTNTMASVVLTKEDKLVVGWLPDWSRYTRRLPR